MCWRISKRPPTAALRLIAASPKARRLAQERGVDISTLRGSGLGMYGVDAFHASVNPPQAALLAVGRIADRVVAVNSQPAVQPMLTLTLSCDHRVVDGARGAQFLSAVADLIEEPLGMLE
ncbi:MAG: 2-oxo acid dehydrogenase subunit E2 [Chloroflexota bacterium]